MNQVRRVCQVTYCHLRSIALTRKCHQCVQNHCTRLHSHKHHLIITLLLVQYLIIFNTIFYYYLYMFLCKFYTMFLLIYYHICLIIIFYITYSFNLIYSLLSELMYHHHLHNLSMFAYKCILSASEWICLDLRSYTNVLLILSYVAPGSA